MEQRKHGESPANLQLLQKDAPIWHGSPGTPGHPLTVEPPHLKHEPLGLAENRNGAAANALPRENALPAASSAKKATNGGSGQSARAPRGVNEGQLTSP